MNPINIQDKTNITITNKKPIQKQPQSHSIKYDEDNQEILKTYKLSKEEIIEYTKIRLELKLTRKELAQKINCLPKEIDLIESGKPCNSNYGGKYKSFLKKNKKL